MAITAEMISERAAAISEKDAAKAAIEEATARYEAAKARIDTVHSQIAENMTEGEVRTLNPSPVPVLMKKEGKIVQGTIQTVHPEAPVQQ